MQVKMGLKLVVLGAVSILLLIALSSIAGITRERKHRLQEVQRGIAESYAGRQQLLGPVFALEYRERWMARLYNNEKNTWYEKEMVALRSSIVYPERLAYDGSLNVQERYRGIFKANVYQSDGHIAGTVRFPALETVGKESNSTIELVSAKACIIVSDPRGISHVPAFDWSGIPLDIQSGSSLEMQGSGIHAELPAPGGLPGKSFDFALDLKIHGMGQFSLVPIGAENSIRLESAWPHPSFVGDFLANDRTVSDQGFAAEWNVNGLACSAQQTMSSGKLRSIQQLGVDLIDPVNTYPLTDRALKYGFLFIFITFAAFFLFELVKQLKIHPVQYGFVGLAQALFFLLLLSLSEHIGFGISYLVASTATIGVIAAYLCSVLNGIKRGLLFGAVLTVLYGALYYLLQSEDHALVAGSSLLFGLLALVMMFTRKIDWYALGAKQTEGVVR
jgi:inner membrane protein